MFCNNCGAQYDVLPIENGKSKFCTNCGNLLYKNENGANVFNNTTISTQNVDIQKRQDAEMERQKQEQIFKHRQLEIQQKQQEAELEQQRQFEIKRQKDLEDEKQRLHELEQQKQAALERKQQEELLKQRQLELEKQKQAELEKIREEEILKQQAAFLAEKVSKEKELALQKQKEIEEREAKKHEELNKQKEAEIERKRQEQIEANILKSSDASNASNEIENENKSVKTEEKKSNKTLYFIIPILLLAIISALSYFIFPEKIKALFGSSHTIADSTVIATTTNISETDSALIEQIKSDLIGKEVLSWNAIKPKEIKELTISSVSEIDKNSNYIIAVQLDDNAGTKAITELLLSYNKIILANVTTTKITYKNTAPTNAWFSFEPIANCRILVNTNNNPIQLKTCDNCEVQKINTNAENALKLVTQPTKIFISSDTKSDAEVDFTYIPTK
ncbi:MAG TPA: hypothetical protein PK431_01025 [Chitinophagales bacterium]|nr:hypothetical protein [Chitinophagales bacterium]